MGWHIGYYFQSFGFFDFVELILCMLRYEAIKITDMVTKKSVMLLSPDLTYVQMDPPIKAMEIETIKLNIFFFQIFILSIKGAIYC